MNMARRVMLTIEVTETLYDALLVTAAMSSTTVDSFIGGVLRETQVRFFATPTADDEDPEPVEILDVRSTAPPPTSTRPLRGVRRELLDLLVEAPVAEGVFDVVRARHALLGSYSGPAISRAVHQLVRRGTLVPVTPTGDGFRPDDSGENRVRFVRLRDL